MSSSQKKPASKPEADDSDWQSQKQTPMDRAKHMLETGLYSDLEFLVGDERQVFKAHKNFLAMTSPVFETMFFGSVPQPQPVVIPDIQPAIFNELLQYIYTNTVDIEAVEDAYSLYYAADKYMLPNLSDRCIQYLKDNLSLKNVFRALEFGTLRGNEALIEACLSMLSLQMYSCYETDNAGFDDLSESALLSILQMGTMDMTELELFHAVDGWAGRQCSKKNVEINGSNKRKELSKAINHIRFLSMTSREFASSPARSGILSESECFAIFMKLNSRDNWPLPFSLSTERKSRGYKGDDGWD